MHIMFKTVTALIMAAALLTILCGCSTGIDKDSKALGTWYATQIVATESNSNWYHAYRLELKDDGTGVLSDGMEKTDFEWSDKRSSEHDVRWTQEDSEVKVYKEEKELSGYLDAFPLEFEIDEQSSSPFLKTISEESSDKNSIAACSFYLSEEEALENTVNKEEIWYGVSYSSYIGYTTYEMRLNGSGLGRLWIRSNKAQPDFPKYGDNSVLKSEAVRVVEWNSSGDNIEVKNTDSDNPFTLTLKEQKMPDGNVFLKPSGLGSGLNGCSFFATQQEAVDSL